MGAAVPIITAVTAIAGTAFTVAGQLQAQEAQEKNAARQREQAEAQQRQAEAQREASLIQQEANIQQRDAAIKAEEERERQTNLDASRRRRDIIRRGIIARAQSQAIATAQGASFGSGPAGAQASITSQTGANVLAVNQNQEIGGNIFAANRQAANAIQPQIFDPGTTVISGPVTNQSGTFNAIGGAFSSLSRTIPRVFDRR